MNSVKNPFKGVNRFGRKNAGVIAVIGILLAAAVLMWPAKVNQHVDQAKESDFLGDLFGLLPGEEEPASGDTLEVQVKYESGTLTHQGQVGMGNVSGASFSVQSTAATGQNARFELVCGTKVCATTGGPYQEPLTFFLVQVPPKNGLTKLTVTAGASYLEVDLA